MYCPNCKKHFESGEVFCPNCENPNGEPIRLVDDPAPAAGASLGFGDATAVSGGVHMADSHDVHNIQNTSNTTIDNRSTVDNSHTVNNSTVYEAQKTQAEIRQENENQFLQAVQERFADDIGIAATDGHPVGCGMRIGSLLLFQGLLFLLQRSAREQTDSNDVRCPDALCKMLQEKSAVRIDKE